VQALILAGGEGTRLRPLTSTIPKPVVPLADRPFISYMLEWLARHGVDEVILSCGFMADGIRTVLGSGEAAGVRLRYLEEPSPLGTGGALKFAEELLDERFFMLNGDVLTDIDLSAQLRAHERTGARATLALIEVEDPSAYGLVRLGDDGSVGEFVEKPGPDQIDTTLVNAGAYVLRRDVLAEMPPAPSKVSIEREVFPRLIGNGLFGFEASGYWLDIGTPERYLQATFDILEGNVQTSVGERLDEAGAILAEGATIEGRVVAPALVGAKSFVAARAVVGGRAVLGRGVRIGEGAHIESSVLLDGAQIGAHSTVSGSIVGQGASIGDGCHLTHGVVLGDNVRLGPDNTLSAGARIFPGVELPGGAIKF
jgi:mannose-1-phosphate guanylyltransferase